MNRKKIFVLDTNVLMHSPNCLETFGDNNIVIPAVCLEELDKFKSGYDLKGFHAREFLRNFEKLRTEQDISKGISTMSGGKVYVKYIHSEISLPIEFENNRSDNIIIKTALQTKKEFGEPVILVSKDTNLRIKSEVLGIKSEDYYHDKSAEDFLIFFDRGVADDTILDEIYENGEISADKIRSLFPDAGRYCLINGKNNGKLGVLIKYDFYSKKYIRLSEKDSTIGITPNNYQQKFLVDALLDDDIKIIFVMGIAGTGKTLLSISSGLTHVLNKKYKKLILSRSPVPMGRDIGFLPGDIQDKLDPWFRPVYDSLEMILEKTNENFMEKKCKNYTNITLEYLKSNNLVEIEGLTYIRGRTFHNSFIIIDEAQNLTPHEVKTIITRVGKNSKIVLTGDIHQIDNPYVDEKDNGLTYASEKFKKLNSQLAETVYLTKCERSEVSRLAATIL